MIIYDYVAASDPWGSKSLLHAYGYPMGMDIDQGDNLAQALNDLHAEYGAEVLEKIIELHPDYKLIVESVSAKDIVSKEKKSGGGCGCGGGCKHKQAASSMTKLAEQSQMSTSNSGWQLHQGNLFLIAATLILAVAIITTHKQSS